MAVTGQVVRDPVANGNDATRINKQGRPDGKPGRPREQKLQRVTPAGLATSVYTR